MKNSKINWTTHTFNPWWGCVKVSDGCKNCYAETFAKRTGKPVWGVDAPRRFFTQKHWNEPLKWNSEGGTERQRVFVGSMCDWAETHRNPVYQNEMNKDRERLAWTINKCTNLDWLLLTKRIEDAGKYLSAMFPEGIHDNVWIGTTVENQEQANKRIPELLQIRASVRFLSVEPMLENVRLFGFNSPTWGRLGNTPEWIICGGESGANARPFQWEWAQSLREQCRVNNVPFWMKQGGGFRPVHELEDFPEDLRIRELPI